MTTATHTPGPWHRAAYRDSQQLSLTVYADTPNGTWEVAKAIGWGGDGEDQAGANARLIAAAPELLEALQSICDGACWSLGSGPRHHIADIPAAKIEHARAMIAKATGA